MIPSVYLPTTIGSKAMSDTGQKIQVRQHLLLPIQINCMFVKHLIKAGFQFLNTTKYQQVIFQNIIKEQ